MRKLFLFGLLLLMTVAACRRRKNPATPTPPEWMDTELDRLATAVDPDAEPLGPPFRAIAFKEDGYTRWQVQLDAGACYIFVGVGDQTSEEMFMELEDPTGDDVVDEKESPARVSMEHCVEKPGTHQILGKVTEGHGHYAVAVYVNTKRGTPPPLEPRPSPRPKPTTQPTASKPNPGPPAGLDAVITKMAKSEASGATLVGDFFTGSADKTDWYSALEKGKCYWFIGAGEKSVQQMHLYLWDPEDAKVTANKSTTNRVTVGHCPTRSGMFHFQAKVQAGSGTYKVGVFAKNK